VALVVALQPPLLVPILVTVAALGGLPLLLIASLALVAVYSPDPSRRAAAEKILDRLLMTLRPGGGLGTNPTATEEGTPVPVSASAPSTALEPSSISPASSVPQHP
jgi:hypothetical protein